MPIEAIDMGAPTTATVTPPLALRVGTVRNDVNCSSPRHRDDWDWSHAKRDR